MRTLLAAASLAAAVLAGPLLSSATAQETPCEDGSASYVYQYQYGWYGHRHVDTHGGRPYYFHNPYGRSSHYRY